MNYSLSHALHGLLGTAISALLIAAPPAKAVKGGNTGSMAGVPFVSTQFDDEVENDLVAGNEPGTRMTLKGVKNVQDLGAKLAVGICGDLMGGGLALQKEMKDSTSLYRPVNQEALKKWVSKLVWVGNRQRGPISGEITGMVVKVTPANISFTNDGVSFAPVVQFEATWRHVSGSLLKSPMVEPTAYNSQAFVKAVQGLVHAKARRDSLFAVMEAGAEVEAQGDAIQKEWSKISVEKNFEGKLPQGFITGRGIDGSLSKGILAVIDKVAEELKGEGDPKGLVEMLGRVQKALLQEMGYQVKVGGAEDSLFPNDTNPTAAKNAVKILLLHEKTILEQLHKAMAAVQQL